jgi:hypothetical protein
MAQIPSENIQPRSGYLFADLENTPLEQKRKPEYQLSIMKATYSQYANNQGDIPFSGVDDHVDNMRNFARGKMNPNELKKYFAGNKTSNVNVSSDIDIELSDEASRKGWFTGMWHMVNFVPNMLTMAKAKFLNEDVDVKVFCVDNESTSQEVLRMNKIWADQHPATNALRQAAGIPVKSPVVNSYQELIDMKNEGSFKDRAIIGIEQALTHTEDISNWKSSQKEKHVDNAFILGSSFAIADYNYNTCKVEWKYVDVKDFSCQYSYEKDYSDIQIAYWFEYLSINQIRDVQDRITDGKKVGLTKEDFENIATKYQDYSVNASSPYYKNSKNTNVQPLDIKVCVMRCRWLDVEKEKESRYTNKGRTSLVEYKEGQENDKKYSITVNRTKKRYECSWLVGTDFIWDYGVSKNQAYKNNNEPTLGVAGFKLMEKSYAERLLPFAKVYAIAFIKFVNALAKSQGDFLAINRLKIAQLTDGGKKMDAGAALRMLRQELVYFYDGDTSSGGGDNVPIKKVDGTDREDMLKNLELMQQMLKLAEIETGISAVSMGATPDNNAPVRTTIASLNSTNSSLTLLFNSVMTLKLRLCEQTIPMIKQLVWVDKKARENYSKVIGYDDVDAMIENRDSMQDMGLALYPRMNGEDKDSFMMQVQGLVQQGLLDSVTAMNINYHLKRGGNMLELMYQVKTEVQRKEKKIQEDKLQLVNAQTEGNKQAAEVQDQSTERMKMAEMQASNAQLTTKGSQERLTADLQAQNNRIDMTLKAKQEAGEDITPFLANLQIMIDEQRKRVEQGQMQMQ